MQLKVKQGNVVVGSYKFTMSELGLYLYRREVKMRQRTFIGCARDGATIELEGKGGLIWPCYILRRDGHEVRIYAADEWAAACDLFMILLNLVPRDQKEVVCDS